MRRGLAQSPIDTQVLLSEDGKLAGAARLDIGTDDLSGTDEQCGEMFICDLRNTLDMFGAGIAEETAVYVFSQSQELTEIIVAGLNDVRIYAKTAELKASRSSFFTPHTL